jgi:hypothetical protein
MNALHAQNGETIGNIAFLQAYPIVAVDALLEIGTDVILVALSLDDHLLQTNTPSRHFVYCCLTRNFLVRTHIAKCFTNSSRRFRCEIMFENEWTHVLLMNTPCLHLHRFCTTGVSSGLATGVTLILVWRGTLEETVTWEWTCLISFLYRSIWLLYCVKTITLFYNNT